MQFEQVDKHNNRSRIGGKVVGNENSQRSILRIRCLERCFGEAQLRCIWFDDVGVGQFSPVNETCTVHGKMGWLVGDLCQCRAEHHIMRFGLCEDQDGKC